MSILRFSHPGHWDAIERHLALANGERFAFALTRVLADGPSGPALVVEDVELVADDDISRETSGWIIADSALDKIHNRAIREGRGLVELHNHRLGPPRFSQTDEAALAPMAEYVLDVVGDRPYAAGVWAGGVVHAEWFRRQEGHARRGPFRSVLAVSAKGVRMLNAGATNELRFDRQVPILGTAGQAVLRQMRVAVVGQGGTGSHASTLLAYLGVRDFVLVDGDIVDPTNLNRVITAEPQDVGTEKTLAARRRIVALDPDAEVQVHPGLTPHQACADLLEVDLIVGCVDHDGPRHQMNELAIEGGVPYIDIGTGVDPTFEPPAIGARVSFVLPAGPCLTCTDELDPIEVLSWHKSSEAQALDVAHGYGTDQVAPSVVHLNGLAVNAAVAEVVAWLSGSRPPALRLDIDLRGDPSVPGVRVGPSPDRERRSGCVSCSWKYEWRCDAA